MMRRHFRSEEDYKELKVLTIVSTVIAGVGLSIVFLLNM